MKSVAGTDRASLKKFKNLVKKLLQNFSLCAMINKLSIRDGCMAYPGVAKFGIALEWGSRGRWFESSHSDHKTRNPLKHNGLRVFCLLFSHS